MSTAALLLTAAGGVAFLLVLVIWLKLHAFVALAERTADAPVVALAPAGAAGARPGA